MKFKISVLSALSILACAAFLGAIPLLVASCPGGGYPAASPTPAPSGSPQASMPPSAKAIFLRHSTGEYVYDAGVEGAIATRNTQLGTNYSTIKRAYPENPWDWTNYPSDYYRLWVGTEGSATEAGIQTLEALCADYDLVIWKHCYPVTDIGPDTDSPNPASPSKTLENYKAAYTALKTKMLSFPNNRFIVWTGAVRLEQNTSQAQAERLKAFRDWVINEWDASGDNIYVFDFWYLQTEGDIYQKAANGVGGGDDHPNATFCATAAPKFAERIVDVFQGRGDTDPLTGL